MPTVTVLETGYPDGVGFGAVGTLKTRVRVLAADEAVPTGAQVVDNATVTYDWTAASVVAYRTAKIAVVALIAGVNTGGGIFAWQNPEGVPICIQRFEVDLKTVTSATCTADFGFGSSNVTSYDNLIDGQDLRSAIGLFNNIEEHGTNGKSKQKVATGYWVTGSVATGASAGLVGYAYIHYHTLS